MKNIIFGITLLIGAGVAGFFIYTNNSFAENNLPQTAPTPKSCSCGEGCGCGKGSACGCNGACGSEGCKSSCGEGCMGSSCMKK